MGCNPFSPETWATDSLHHVTQAEKFVEEKKYDEAISEYQKHIDLRLRDTDREIWENPYFYEIMIGDVYLKKDDDVSALNKYLEAEKHGVEKELIIDRVRLLALHLEEKGDLEKAMTVLTQHRTMDPLLFDVQLDRLARKKSALDDQ